MIFETTSVWRNCCIYVEFCGYLQTKMTAAVSCNTSGTSIVIFILKSVVRYWQQRKCLQNTACTNCCEDFCDWSFNKVVSHVVLGPTCLVSLIKIKLKLKNKYCRELSTTGKMFFTFPQNAQSKDLNFPYMMEVFHRGVIVHVMVTN